MPIQPNPQSISAWPNQVNVPSAVPGFFLSVQLQTDGTPTVETQDELLQDLIDYLQEWPGRSPGENVTGQKYDTKLYLVTPTNPIVP